MKLRALPVFGLLVSLSLALPAFSQEAPQCLASSLGNASAVVAELPQDGGDAGLQNLLGDLERGNVENKQTGCTASYDCLTGQHISCTGSSNCTPTTVACSTQGSTCPEQGATVGAVKCNGVVQATCPCPGVCFGCGAFCQTNTQCASVCSCGGGKCVSGRCSCKF